MPYRRKGREKFRKKRLPYIVTKSAQTLDGKIATFHGDSKWITSEQARTFSRKNRDQFDAIMVGCTTVLKDNPWLNGVSKKRRLRKIIVDASLKTSLKSNLFKGMPPGSCIIATTKKAPFSKIRSFERQGIFVVVCPAKKLHVDITWLMHYLAMEGVSSLLIEGGSRLIGRALENNLVDEMHIYIAPKILGDERGLGSVVGRSVKNIKGAIDLKFVQIKRIGEDVLFIAHVHRHR